jgi:hypothetical protein
MGVQVVISWTSMIWFLALHLVELRDRSLFMEGGRGNFSFLIFKIECPPPLKEQKFNDDPPYILEYFSLTPPPFSFLLVKWGFPGVIVLIIN